MKRMHAAMVVLGIVCAGGMLTVAQDMGGGAPAHILLAPDDIKWGDAPASLPPGAKLAVIEGNPKNAGLFTMRLKLPADYKILPHKHPADEHVTVISGMFCVGVNDKIDPAKTKELPAGGFAVAPAKIAMYAFTKDQETIVQIHGMGPWGIEYVNPTDDPRNKK